jgi:tight adherence protein B
MKRLPHLLLPLLLCGLAVVLFGSRADAEAPVDDVEVMLAIDTSGSMRLAIGAAKAAAAEFVASMPPQVNIGVETFGDSVTVLTPPTTDRDLVNENIDAIVTGGNTALYDSVVVAAEHFTPTAGHKVLVLLSDGKDEGSTATLDEAVAAVEGVHVEAISLTTAETDMASLSALGPVTSADDASGMSAAFARVADLVAAVVVEPVPVSSTVPPVTSAAVPTTITEAASPTTAAAAVTVTTNATVPAAVATPSTANTSSFSLWLGATGLFVGLFMLGLLLFPRGRVSKARLGIEKPRSASEMGTRAISAVEVALERGGRRAQLATALAVADISMKPAEFVATVAVVAIVAGLVGLLLGGPLLGLIVALAVCLAVRVHVSRTKAKRQAAFADQLPDVLQLVTTALRSGYGLTQALDSVAEDAEEPARSEFTHVLVESRLGRDLSESMRALAQRMASEDLEWVVAAIDINRETGGNLSEILSTVGATIRERQRMVRQVRTLTAEGRLSARILTVLPLLMAFWQWRMNPVSFALLTHGGGLVALGIGAILMILGTLWIRRIVNSLAI